MEIDEKSIEALSQYAVGNQDQYEDVFLAYLITDKNLWFLRKPEYSQYFVGIVLVIYQAVDVCVEYVNEREVFDYFSKVYENDDQQYDAIVEKYNYLCDLNLKDESFQYVLQVLRKNFQRRVLAGMCTEVLLGIKSGEPEEKANLLQQKLYTIKDRPIEYSNYFLEVKQRIEHVEEEKTVKYFASGIPELDQDNNGGFRFEDYILLVGPTGSGKSFFLAQLAYSCAKQGGNVIYFQGEMTLQLSNMRLDSRIGDVYFSRIRSGEVIENEKTKWERNVKELASFGGSIHTYKLSREHFHTHMIRQTIEQLKVEKKIFADIILVDYILLMSLYRQTYKMPPHERLELISRDLKDISNSYERNDGSRGVIMATVSQGKPNLAKLKEDASLEDAIAYSAAMGHDATHVYVLSEQDEADMALGRKVLRNLKNRNAEKNKRYLITQELSKGIFHTGISTHEND